MKRASVIGALLLAVAAWIGAAARIDVPQPSPSGAPVVVASDAPAARRAVRRGAAAAFLEAFVRYEAGAPPRRWRRTLRSTATPELARELEKHPPRVPGEIPVARLTRVIAGRRTRRAITVLATLDRRGARASLVLVLVRRHGSWRVAELGR